VFDCDEVKN